MKAITKSIIRWVFQLAGVLDAITAMFLAGAQIYYIAVWDVYMFLIATIASGVWCISCKFAELKDGQ